jgi:putative DNA primase/helicase
MSENTSSLIIRFDGPLEIATGRSRKELQWKNSKTIWSQLVRRFSQTHRTPETLSEYLSSDKSRQDEIKDVGGFVGGYINTGRRKTENILRRSMLTLDLDFAKPGFWELYAMIYDNSAVLYSTHKHQPEKPRLRLIIPLSRPVTVDEYAAVSRRIAGNLGIDNFDDTTFEAARLMYWPSTSSDAEFLFEFQDGPWLDPDQVLAMYSNWHDISEWPSGSRTIELVRHGLSKQGDPLSKPGLIGAFCRTYTIQEAIDIFLPEIYKPCDIENRFTFVGGSTSAGLVVYEDKHAFSHHGTDSASGKLCNAFDLVRIHLFGEKDKNAKENTPSNRLPSFLEMENFASSDANTRIAIASERIQSVKDDFGESFNEDADNSWLGKLQVDRRGIPLPSIDNALLILRHDPALKGLFALNKFDIREIATRDMPWRKITIVNQFLKDSDDSALRHYFEKRYSFRNRQAVQDALAINVEQNAFHPVKNYLSNLSWDGATRIDTLLIDYLGASDSEFTRQVIRKVMVAAVKRIYHPGAKFDYVLTLVGPQGAGKSTFVQKIGMSWYSDSFGTIQGKEAYDSIQGVWIMEMGELAGLRKAEMETIKHFISKCEDRYRVAYGKRTETFPRQCIFIGTTNNREFLNDPTGNRRFWPVDVAVKDTVRSIWRDLNQSEIDQLWAEAVTLYKAGESVFLDKDLELQATEIQGDHTELDERTSIVQEFLDKPIPANWYDFSLYEKRSFLQSGPDPLMPADTILRHKISVIEIWTELFGKSQADMARWQAKEIHNLMRNIEGWEPKRIRTKNDSTQRGYIRSI